MSIHAVSKQRHNFDGFNSTTKDGELDVETEILKKLLNISGRVYSFTFTFTFTFNIVSRINLVNFVIPFITQNIILGT